MILKDPCHELAEAKPIEIPALITKILNRIRIIWVNSEYYNTKERLAGILKKVSLYLSSFIFLLLKDFKSPTKTIFYKKRIYIFIMSKSEWKIFI